MVAPAAQEVKALLVGILLFLQYQQLLVVATVEMVLLDPEVLLAAMADQEAAAQEILLVVLHTLAEPVSLVRALVADQDSIQVDLTQAVGAVVVRAALAKVNQAHLLQVILNEQVMVVQEQ
jgi:hypothetical protein